MPDDVMTNAQPAATVSAPAAPATTPASASVTSSSSAPAQSPAASTPSVEDILRFDPFGPETEGTQEGVMEPAKTGEVAPAAKTGKDGDGSKAETPTQPQQAEPVANPEMELLKKQLKEANDVMEQMKAMAASNQAQKQKEPPKDDTPAYDFKFPEPLLRALQSEDPKEFQEGMANLSTGVARGVHQTVMKQVYDLMPKVIAASVQAMQQHSTMTNETQTMRSDFYGKYPHLDKPELHPIVGMVAQQLGDELKVSGYSAEFRDALAARLSAMGIGTAAPVQPITPPPPQPTIMSGGGARPAPTFADEQQKQMMDLLND